MHIHPQEVPNRDKITEDGLAYIYKREQSLSKQIEEVIQTFSLPKGRARPKSKWLISDKLLNNK